MRGDGSAMFLGIFIGAVVVMFFAVLANAAGDKSIAARWCKRIAEVSTTTWPECVRNDQKVLPQ